MRLGMKTLAFGLVGTAMVAVSLVATAHDGKLTLAPVLAEATPAVVGVQVELEGRRSPWGSRSSAGSGVIIDARRGHVVTNHHVIDDADKIVVTLEDRREFEAELIGTDQATDIALLKIDGDDLQALPLGNSDELSVGDFVIAIGNPFNLGQTATWGMVSALGRSGFTRDGYEDFIQTDASINHGNSGGALVDLNGQLVGINSRIVSPSGVSAGLGFAVPANIVRTITEKLVEHGEVQRGQLGVMIGNVSPDNANLLGLESDKGAVVGEVVGGSAAETAGIEPGDVIVRLNDEEVENANDLRNRIGLASAGDEVELVVMRDGKALNVEATLGDAAAANEGRATVMDSLAGARLRDLSPAHRLFGRVEGVEVAEVSRGTRAWELGLQSGDVIVAVNGRPIDGLLEFEQRVADGRSYTMLVRRGLRQLFFIVD